MQSLRFLPFVCSPRVGVNLFIIRSYWMGVSKGKVATHQPEEIDYNVAIDMSGSTGLTNHGCE
jgi:hypothetical protein